MIFIPTGLTRTPQSEAAWEAAGTTGAQLLYFHSTNLQGNGMRETTQLEFSENENIPYALKSVSKRDEKPGLVSRCPRPRVESVCQFGGCCARVLVYLDIAALLSADVRSRKLLVASALSAVRGSSSQHGANSEPSTTSRKYSAGGREDASYVAG